MMNFEVGGPALQIQPPTFSDKTEAECREIIAEATAQLNKLNLAVALYDLRVEHGDEFPSRDLDVSFADVEGQRQHWGERINYATNRINAIRAEAEAVKRKAERREIWRRTEAEWASQHGPKK